MKFLYAGSESEERFEIILSFTSIKSESIKKALKYHYVLGWDDKALETIGIHIPNFKRAQKVIEGVAEKLNKLYELDNVRKVTNA